MKKLPITFLLLFCGVLIWVADKAARGHASPVRDEFASGVVITGTVGSEGTARSDAGLEIQHSSFPLLSIANFASNPTPNDTEGGIVFAMKNSDGVLTKATSIFARCLDCSTETFTGRFGVNVPYGPGGGTSIVLNGFGGPNGYGSAYFFGFPSVAPPERQLFVDGDVKITGKVLDDNDAPLTASGTWTPTLSGFTITGGGSVAASCSWERISKSVTVDCSITPSGGAYITITTSSIMHGVPSGIAGTSPGKSGTYDRADGQTHGGVLVSGTDIYMTTAAVPSPAAIVIGARYLMP